MKKFILLINCKDQSGIIAATTNFILKCDGNITYVDQHVDHQEGVFFMRLECTLNNVEIQNNFHSENVLFVHGDFIANNILKIEPHLKIDKKFYTNNLVYLNSINIYGDVFIGNCLYTNFATINSDLITRVISELGNENFTFIINLIEELHPADTADLLETLNSEDRKKIVKI